MINALNGAASSAAADSAGTTTSANSVDALASESTFLQLLVAQLKNQDPENPQDGTQFVAQLAQFSSLEQQLQMRQDLDAIKTTLQTTSGPSQSSNSTSNSSDR